MVEDRSSLSDLAAAAELTDAAAKPGAVDEKTAEEAKDEDEAAKDVGGTEMNEARSPGGSVGSRDDSACSALPANAAAASLKIEVSDVPLFKEPCLPSPVDALSSPRDAPIWDGAER